MAGAHTIWGISSQALMDGIFYDESRYDRQDIRQEAWDKKRALAALERLGDNVTLLPVTEAAQVHSASV